MVDAPGMRKTPGRPVKLGGIAGSTWKNVATGAGGGSAPGATFRMTLWPARSGRAAPGARGRNDVTDREDRRTNHALRRRIDQLLGRVRAAQEEIVERGLDAVQETKDLDDEAAARRPSPKSDDEAAKPSNGAAKPESGAAKPDAGAAKPDDAAA
jgi:hypothetical protein